VAEGTQLSFNNGVGFRWLEVVADPIRLSILRSLSETDAATATDLAARGQASIHTIRRHLDALLALGVVHEDPGESDGQSPGRPAARFRLEAEIRESLRSLRSA
jgi:predicted ArsR family transcriptional regulator